MTTLTGSVLAFGAGGGLSLLYFGGLWLTVQRAVDDATRPTLLLLGSFVGRTALVLLGFHLVIVLMDDQWTLLVASLLGFIAGRTLLVRRWRFCPTPSS
jgi:F1F0 ATPase subunit 2